MDHQVTLYIYAARQLGYPVACVLYDVARKPTVKPTLIPMLDDDGLKIVVDAQGNRVRNASKFVADRDENGQKIVLDANGIRVAGSKPGTWRQTPDEASGQTLKTVEQLGPWRQTQDADLGYVLQTRPMKVEEWGEKLYADIAERPEYYFSRVEVARLDKDIEEYMYELWDIQQSLLDAQKKQAWYRTVSKDTCQYCDYFALCASGEMPTVAPDGFVILDNKHPELEIKHDKAAFTAATTTDSEATDDDTSGSYW